MLFIESATLSAIPILVTVVAADEFKLALAILALFKSSITSEIEKFLKNFEIISSSSILFLNRFGLFKKRSFLASLGCNKTFSQNRFF